MGVSDGFMATLWHGGRCTLVTATWKVYSVTSFGVLFEKVAAIWIMDSLVGGLDTLKEMVTWRPWMTKSLAIGRLLPSSGRAELKFHSSSADAPFVCGCGRVLGGSKPNSEGGGVGTGG